MAKLERPDVSIETSLKEYGIAWEYEWRILREWREAEARKL